MPLHSYTCTVCSQTTEEIFSVSETIPKEYECEHCGEAAIFNFPLFAKTSRRWGDGQSYFDRGLGCEVKNSMHREAIMKERGLVPLDKKAIEKQQATLEGELTKAREHEKTIGTERSVEKLTEAIDNL